MYEYVRVYDCRRPPRHLAVKLVHTTHGAHQIKCINVLLSVMGSLFTARSFIFTLNLKRRRHSDIVRIQTHVASPPQLQRPL